MLTFYECKTSLPLKLILNLKKCIFTRWVIWSRPSISTHGWGGGHEIYNFIRPFPGHHHFILSLSDLCLIEEKKIFNEILIFIKWSRPSTRTPAHETYNFGRLFIGHHYYLLSLSNNRKEEYERNTQFSNILLPNYLPLGWSRGSWKLHFLIPSPYRCYIPFGLDWFLRRC